MRNRMVNKEFAQEIAAVIRTAQNGDRLPELLKHYHQRDVAKAVTLLTDAERERLFRQMDAQTLAEIFPYLDDASRYLAELPAAEDISVDGTTDEIRQLRKELQRVQELLSRSYTKAELLRANHLRLPRIAHLMAILRDRDGLDVTPVGTIGAARRELLRLLKQEELL